jgi:hypothetical protein
MRLRGQANQSSEHDELHTDREKDTYTTSRIRNQNKDRHSLIRNKRLTWRRKAARVEGELKTLTTQTGPPAGLCFCFTRRVKGTLSLPSPQLVRKAKPTMMMINQRAAAGGRTSTSGRICNLQGTSSLSLLCHGIDSDREARHTHLLTTPAKKRCSEAIMDRDHRANACPLTRFRDDLPDLHWTRLLQTDSSLSILLARR